MDEKALSEFMVQKIRQWHTSQESQTDGYNYEDSLVKMVDEIGADILKSGVGVLPENRKLKKTLTLFGEIVVCMYKTVIIAML